MITIYQIRGTNGSGKSTLVRGFIKGDPAAPANRPGVPDSPMMVDLVSYAAPLKMNPQRRKYVEGYGSMEPGLDIIVVGSYRTACGGLDGVNSFDRQFRAIRQAVRLLSGHTEPPAEGAVLCEGVLASTVAGSWFKFAKELRTVQIETRMAFCYLDTPVEVCLERIRKRQEAAGKVRPINEQLVRDKERAVAATREKAIAAGELVYDLPWESADVALRAIMVDSYVVPTIAPGVVALSERVHARRVYRAS